MRENAVPIDGEKSAAIARACQQAAIRCKAEGVNDVFARRPKLFGRAIGADAVDAARDKTWKWSERLLGLGLPGVHHGASEGSRALRCRDNRGGRLPGALLRPNRGNRDGAICG